MALNASGPISIGGATTGQSINLELGLASNNTSSLNDTSLRTLAGVASGAISMANFYGKSASVWTGPYGPTFNSDGWQCLAADSTGQKLVAGGGYYSVRKIYTSTDYGRNWIARDSARDWRGVASSSDGTKLVACVYAGSIYRSTDSGVTWSALASAGTRAWINIACSSDGTKIFALDASPGFIYYSPDSGATWAFVGSSQEWRGISCSADGAYLIASANSNYLYTSSNSGTSWTSRVTDTTRSWRKTACSSTGQYMYGVLESFFGNVVYRSSDYGVTWSSSLSMGASTYAVGCSADGMTVAVGRYNGTGNIHVSTDYGATWTDKGVPDSVYWQAITVAGGRITAVSENGEIWTSP